ncbi:unnamed protein product [Ceutorhynchus assimilis]|uniref:Rho GTPase activating protein 21 n=1 Tax=Ceutorhynchus assimilis TaxID=467358 RepID=A0A9P0DGF5_9CUCU|nr:unnamed protein product [Ceutorhynchus assimilis]
MILASVNYDINEIMENNRRFYTDEKIFQRPQETQAERRFPGNSTGIVPLPRGSKGPRSLYLRRYEDSFGFTLRHFIVYPPELVGEDDGRHAACGALLAPMDTIFVRHVRDRSSAKQAGLQRGDRLVAVNGVPTAGRTYQQVVQLITNSPEYLHLLVVPKEEDVLQRFFPDTAYNPVSNQPSGYPEGPIDRASAQKILTQRITQRAAGIAPQEFRVDAASWRYLQQQPYYEPQQQQPPSVAIQHHNDQRVVHRNPTRQEFAKSGHQRSAESILDSRGRGPYGQQHQEIYAEIHHPNEVHLRQKSRAQPQVPLYRKMGRRASEGSNLLSSVDYSGVASLISSDGGDSEHNIDNMKAMHNKPYHLLSGGDNLTTMGLPETKCRLPGSEAARRESCVSLSSSIADSNTSYGSNSTLTGHEIDDSVRLSRVRQSVRQKEEFLRTPVFREFHGRPKKLDRPVWPPNEPLPIRQDNRQAYHNSSKVRNDYDKGVATSYQGDFGGIPSLASPSVSADSPKDKQMHQEGVREAEMAPTFDGGIGEMARETTGDDRRMNNPNAHFQNVQKKAKEFECYPDDNRRDFSRSELARLSKKVLQPKVTERAQEYEVKTTTNDTLRKDPSSTSTVSAGSTSAIKRIQRDSRSLDSSDISNEENRQFRARSNSAESWATAVGDKDSVTATPPPQISTPPTPGQSLSSPSPLIPEPVSQLHLSTPIISVTPARPNSLDLDQPQRPARGHFKADHSPNPVPVVVRLRTKNNFGHDDRSKRPDSYLKATKGEQTSFGSDLSDFEDVSPQMLRSQYRKWHPSPFFGDIEQLRKLFEETASSKGDSNSSSNVSLERDKASVSPVPFNTVVREGTVNCKILEIDGKRAADRSWKQVLMVLKGPKLFLFKDRHHQSPLGTSDVSLDQSLAAGVDMRSSAVRVAGDYTKRKNVLRMSTVKPCRSEFLIQAESSEDFADWVKTLQERVAINTDAELDPTTPRQRAVPQSHPASTTIQVQGSHLSPQPSAKSAKSIASRNRSPTGQSPVSKTRKPSTQHDSAVATTSPKSKTWRVRMAKQLKKFNPGTSSPSSPIAPEVSTFGIPIEHCIPSSQNQFVPKFIEVCTDIIDEKGLQIIGIYRVPGNNASITALSEEINKNFEEVPLEDQRWNDLHVVSSLLKSFLRKMPDSLVTSILYPHFIKADKIEDPKSRMEELKRLVRNLPRHNYHTLKQVILHLKRVAENSHINKMEVKNLAIVFGPTIVRPESETMESMVTNMNNQCKIVESLITNADWYFPENDSENVAPVVPLAIPDNCDEFEANNQALLNNISKYEAFTKDQKEKNGALLSSLFTAAQRKVLRKPSRQHNQESGREEPTTPTSPKSFGQFTSVNTEFGKIPERTPDNSTISTIPTTVTDIEKRDKNIPPTEKNPWFNYKTDQSDFSRRVENFKQETEAMLQRPRMTEISVSNIDHRGQLSSSATNVNAASRMSLKPNQDFLLTKTHSANNVFTRPSPPANRNSLNSMDSMVQYTNSGVSSRYSYGATSKQSTNGANVGTTMASGGDVTDSKGVRYGMRRGSSVENVNLSTLDLNSNNGAGLKKIKYESENDSQRRGSLDSLHKIPTEDESLLSTMTKLIDQKLKEKSTTSSVANISVTKDDAPQKQLESESPNKENNRPRPSDLYKNPSLHKGQYTLTKNIGLKESKNEKEKEEDTLAFENLPDNERHISLTLIANKINAGSKLKRSESLNKPERTISPLNTKVKRSESLNKTGDRVKRSDSLTKTEKTESNINKRRELLNSGRRLKESTKNKRKNGMPDRSIKRRHTVGGTKDPDKVTYLIDNKNENEKNQNNEKGIRTSSPDLSSTRRERFLFEINLIGPENMVVALRQHLIGSRPQSFPESTVYKVLESHV